MLALTRSSRIVFFTRLPVLYRTARYVPKFRTDGKSKPQTGTLTVDDGPLQMNIDQLMQILPTLPSHQQQMLREALEQHGKDNLEKMVNFQPDIGQVQEMDQNPGESPHPPQTSYAFAVDLVTQHLMSSGLIETPNKHSKGFWKTVSDFSKLKAGPDDQPPFELLGQLFEIAKLQPTPNIRPKCIKLVGDIIYSFNTARMDPFNEVEYLDALCLHGNTFRAIELWKSRRDKDDVKDSLYWLEVGALYYQQTRNLANAEAVADEMALRFNSYIPPRVIIGFLVAYSQLKQMDKVEFWYKKLLEAIDEQGVLTNKQEASTNSVSGGQIEQEQANKMFNVPKQVKEDELQTLLKCLLESRNWEYAALLIDDLNRVGIAISLDSTLATLDATTRRMVEYEPAAYTKKRRHGPATESNKKLTVVITKLISEYPELLDNPKFYESWLRGLAGLEFYQHALMVIDAMVNRGIKPNITHMHTLIKALLAKNQLDTSLDLLKRMETRLPDSLYPPVNSSIYSLFLQYGARRSDDKFVQNVLQRMDEHGCQQSQATFNTLMFYYYRHHQYQNIFSLYRITESQQGFEFFDQVNYRTLWLIFRDYYRQAHIAQNAVVLLGIEPPNLRDFFVAMIHSPKFKLSLNVYEYALHALMLSRDFEATAAAICHLETVNNIKLQGDLVSSVIQLAYKLKTQTRFAFARPTKRDMLVDPGYSDPNSPSLPWNDLVIKMAQVMEKDEEEATRWIQTGQKLCEEFNNLI